MAGQLNIRTVKLGENADTSKNFLITTPAVADGSLTISTESGVPVLTRTADVAITIGVAQTWQNVTGSRTSGTTYTNSTGQTIDISVIVTSVGSATATFAVNAVAISNPRLVAADGRLALHGRVPTGATYSVTVISGTLSTWMELR